MAQGYFKRRVSKQPNCFWRRPKLRVSLAVAAQRQRKVACYRSGDLEALFGVWTVSTAAQPVTKTTLTFSSCIYTYTLKENCSASAVVQDARQCMGLARLWPHMLLFLCDVLSNQSASSDGFQRLHMSRNPNSASSNRTVRKTSMTHPSLLLER